MEVMTPQIVENIILAVVGVWLIWKLDQLILALRLIAYRPDPTGREAQVASTKETPPKFTKGERNLYVPDTMIPRSFNDRFKDGDA